MNKVTAERKRSEEDVKRQLTLLETTLESMGHGFCVYDVDQKVVAYNKEFLRLARVPAGLDPLGLSHEQILRHRVTQGVLGGVDTEEKIKSRLNRIINLDERDQERMLPDGTTFVYRRKPMPGGGYVATYTDITEHKKTERALKINSALLQTSLESMGHGFCVFDADHKVAAYNKQYPYMARLPKGLDPMGLSYEQILRHRSDEGVFDEEELQRRLQLVKDKRESRGQERVHPDGTVFMYQRKPMPDGGFVLTYTDITERKQSEQELEKKSALLEATFSNMSQGFAVFDTDFKLVSYNQNFLDFSFYPPGFLHIGTTWEDVLRFNARLKPRDHQGGEEEFVQTRIQRVRDGKKFSQHGKSAPNNRFIELNRNPMPDGGFVVTLTDITERKHAEDQVWKLNESLEAKVEERTAELKSAQEGLLRAERLAALGQLTSTVAHELRNPLGAVSATAKTIELKNQEAGLDLANLFARMNRSIQRCDNIITELLDFARAKGLEIEPTPLDSWVSETLEEISIPQGITLHRDLDAKGMVLEFDRDRLRRVLINVVDNACQAMDEGDGGELTVASSAGDGRVVITITDTGTGIPEDVLPKIFEPLFSTKQFGVGLGLSTVRKIMEEHGGGFEITNAEGAGTRATLWLPLTAS